MDGHLSQSVSMLSGKYRDELSDEEDDDVIPLTDRSKSQSQRPPAGGPPPKKGSRAMEFSDTRKVLLLINLMWMNVFNFMDRASLGAILPYLQKYYDLSNTEAGFLKTVFVIGNTCGSLTWGVIGRRADRKYVVLCSMTLWVFWIVIASIAEKDQLPLLTAARFFVGFFGAAPHVLVATIFSDIYTARRRPLIISIFITSAVIGSASAFFLVNLELYYFKNLFGLDRPAWKWAMDVPALGMFPALLTAFFIVPSCPPYKSPNKEKKTNPFDDIKYLFTCKTYMFIAVGAALLDFSNAAFSYWGNLMVIYAIYQWPEEVRLNIPHQTIIGFEAALSGALGGLVIAEIGRQLKNRKIKDGQSLVAGLFCLQSGILCFVFQQLIVTNIVLAWVVAFFVGLTIVANNATGADIIMACSPPFVRPMAQSLHTVITHIGDGLAPIFIGAVSDALMVGQEDTWGLRFNALRDACTISYVFSTVGGALTLFSSLTYAADCRRAEQMVDVEVFTQTMTAMSIKRKRNEQSVRMRDVKSDEY